MAALDIILEIVLHLFIYFQFPRCKSGLAVEIQIFQCTAFAVAFQIIVDHPVNYIISRNRETESPFIIDHGNPVVINQDIGRYQVNV